MKSIPRLHLPSSLQTFLMHAALAILMGVLWYLILYGHYYLHFTHVNWIYKAGGDVLQHQLGWEWFRQESWQFPLGKITAYGFPFGTSVTFMDSIPLLAIPFKLFAPLFKVNHQYLGVWELSAVIGQMLAGLLILHEFSRSYPVKILGASLLVLSPPMIFRAFYHSSLSAHWILLLAIWFLILEYRYKLWRGAWICLFTGAVLINIYYIPMLLPLWLIGVYFRLAREKKKSLRLFLGILGDGLAICAGILLAGYSTGLFSLGYQTLSVEGFGVFSWNLNGFINPFSYSSNFLKERATGVNQQYEGFSYLGLGNLMLIPAALYVFVEKNYLRRYWSFLLPFGVAAIVYILYSLSNRAFLDTIPLWDIQFSDSISHFFNLFRASGRFIWPVFYFLVLFGLILIIRNVRLPVIILSAIVVLQFGDILPLSQPKKLSDITIYQSPLQSEFWQSAALANDHLVIIPAKRLRPPYEPFAMYAVRNHLTLNLGYFARYDAQAFEEYSQTVWGDLQAHKPDSQTIYILSDPEWITFAKENLADDMYLCQIDTFTVLFSAENELSQTISEFSPYCSVPAP